MRRAVLAAAVTSGLLAMNRRRPASHPAVAPDTVGTAPIALPPLPGQRTRLLEDGADLSVDDQQAQDDRILALLDQL